jgi:hypothetical protein
MGARSISPKRSSDGPSLHPHPELPLRPNPLPASGFESTLLAPPALDPPAALPPLPVPPLLVPPPPLLDPPAALPPLLVPPPPPDPPAALLPPLMPPSATPASSGFFGLNCHQLKLNKSPLPPVNFRNRS